MSDISIQTFQGSGFQKGGVFDTGMGNSNMDRPRAGFFAGAVYGTVASTDNSMGAPVAPPQGGATFGGGSFSSGGSFGGGFSGGGTFSSRP